MMKRKSRLWMALTGFMLVAGILTGCGEKVTTESLLKDVNENYKQAESFKGDLKLDVTVQNPLGELINFCTKQRIFKTCFAILFR
ncbi:hypothetical protein [Hespellia stercorisuis]|uniref:Uncharacterized protein n=1 Tax=Hespellia stercorisuis DSM 15480 TaxID=1121950 RepID=A0A1M6VZB5_9FIRM|nr:hypothetical protein [Hespellia stercorisuis]SHK86842.1 hypothetical protein SAMN02745243_03893 [Hespellia stercorisuis DSM 15480]